MSRFNLFCICLDVNITIIHQAMALEHEINMYFIHLSGLLYFAV